MACLLVIQIDIKSVWDTIIVENSLLEMIRLYLYDCSVYLVTALISIGLTMLILRTYLPLFVLRNGSLYAIIRTCSYICTYFLFVLHTLMYTYDILFCFIFCSTYVHTKKYWQLSGIFDSQILVKRIRLCNKISFLIYSWIRVMNNAVSYLPLKGFPFMYVHRICR